MVWVGSSVFRCRLSCASMSTRTRSTVPLRSISKSHVKLGVPGTVAASVRLSPSLMVYGPPAPGVGAPTVNVRVVDVVPALPAGASSSNAFSVAV